MYLLKKKRKKTAAILVICLNQYGNPKTQRKHETQWDSRVMAV